MPANRCVTKLGELGLLQGQIDYEYRTTEDGPNDVDGRGEPLNKIIEKLTTSPEVTFLQIWNSSFMWQWRPRFLNTISQKTYQIGFANTPMSHDQVIEVVVATATPTISRDIRRIRQACIDLWAKYGSVEEQTK
ncbi:MAG: hypothetical protein NVSMB46_03340 [Candidatus Saccharimonadales bacterium]